MTTENFCYWLQGYLEISDANTIDKDQLVIIMDHLDLVFTKITSNELGYQLLDTTFTGSSSEKYC